MTTIRFALPLLTQTLRIHIPFLSYCFSLPNFSIWVSFLYPIYTLFVPYWHKCFLNITYADSLRVWGACVGKSYEHLCLPTCVHECEYLWMWMLLMSMLMLLSMCVYYIEHSWKAVGANVNGTSKKNRKKNKQNKIENKQRLLIIVVAKGIRKKCTYVRERYEKSTVVYRTFWRS